MHKNKLLWLPVSILIFVLLLLTVYFFPDRPDTHTITISIPAYQQEAYFFSDTVFQTTGNRIYILSGQDLGDAMVVLKTVQVRQKNAYEPTYITPGLEVEMTVEKGASFRIGVLASNPSQTPKEIHLTVSGIQ